VSVYCRLFYYWLFALAFFPLLGCQNREEKTPVPPDVQHAFQQLVDLKTDSYHTLLREASLLVPPVLKDRDRNAAEKFMRTLGFSLEEKWNNGIVDQSDYLIKRNAVPCGKNHSLDLHFVFATWINKNTHELAPPRTLDWADLALVDDIDRPYRQVIDESRYATGSVLDVILRCASIQKEGERWSSLKRMRVHYGPIFVKWLDTMPSGFSVEVEFRNSVNENDGYKRMRFYVVSGLDPWRSLGGKLDDKQADFKPSDTLGEMIEGGSSESRPIIP
jgi:hypothetical protein